MESASMIISSPNSEQSRLSNGSPNSGFSAYIMTGDTMIQTHDPKDRPSTPNSTGSRSRHNSSKYENDAPNSPALSVKSHHATHNLPTVNSNSSLRGSNDNVFEQPGDITEPGDSNCLRRIDSMTSERSSVGSLDDIHLDMDKPFLSPQPVDNAAASRLSKRLYNLDGFKISDVSPHLTKNNAFAQKVAEDYLGHFDFADLTLVDAMRLFFKRLYLYGETQEQERVLLYFSRRYLECNAEMSEQTYFGDKQDSCHMLVTALMLLNTDLHGQNVASKMSQSMFIEQLAGYNGGQNYPEQLLKHSYQSVKHNQFTFSLAGVGGPVSPSGQSNSAEDSMPGDLSPTNHPILHHNDNSAKTLRAQDNPFLSAADFQAGDEMKKGQLLKKHIKSADGVRVGTGKRTWKSHYAVLKGMVLYLAKSEKHLLQQKIQKAIHVHHSIASPAREYKKRPFVFSLVTADWSEYLFATGSVIELDDWVNTINLTTSTFSSEPLAAAVGSQAKFNRPLLPSAPIKQPNIAEQCAKHEERCKALHREIEEEQKYPPEKSASKNAHVYYRNKMEYLKFERQRYMIYAQLLRSQIDKYPDLNLSLLSASIGESDETPISQQTNDNAQGSTNHVTDIEHRAPGNSLDVLWKDDWCKSMYVNLADEVTYL